MVKKMQLGATPSKLALVAILAVIFAVVLVFQFGGSSSQSTTPVVPRAPKAVAQRTTSAARVAPASTSIRPNTASQPRTVKHVALETRPLPKFSGEEAASHDPFYRPSHLRPSASDVRPDANRLRMQQAERERTLAEVRKFVVAAIFQSDTEQVAVIDDQTVRVGDVFQGFRVTAIEAEGVKLEEQHTNGR